MNNPQPCGRCKVATAAYDVVLTTRYDEKWWNGAQAIGRICETCRLNLIGELNG